MTMTRLDGMAEAADRISATSSRYGARSTSIRARVRGAANGGACRGVPEAPRHSLPHRHRQDGIVALLRGGNAGPDDRDPCRHGRAADQRARGLAVRVEGSGKMHACGHDAHTAIVARRRGDADAMRDDIVGRVMFVFQPAEETLTGAAACSKPGLSDPVPTPSSAFTTGRSFAPGPSAGIPMR
jgi:hypothetical protein